MFEEPKPTRPAPLVTSIPRNINSDRFSTWSVVLIVLTVLYSLFSNNLQDSVTQHFAKHRAVSSGYVTTDKRRAVSPGPVTTDKHRVVSSGPITTDTFGHLVAIDGEVKQAYLSEYMASVDKAAGVLSIQTKSKNNTGFSATFDSLMKKALDESESGLRDSPSSMYFARRVILIRAALKEPALAPIKSSGKHLGLSSPLQAYELSAEQDPVIAVQVRHQELIWKNIFSSPTIPASKVPTLLSQLRQHPTLLFYNLIASQYIYKASGNTREANRIGTYIERRSLISMVGTGGVTLVAFVLLLAGLVVWGGSISMLPAISGRSRNLNNGIHVDPRDPITQNFFSRFVVPLPERIAKSDRKLRAGDLLDCFAIYLLSLNLLSILLSYLITKVPHPNFDRMSDLHLIYWEIGLALLGYVGASGLAFLVVVIKARQRGASLSIELGLTTNGAFKNSAYGAVGWGASLLFMFALNFLLSKVLHKLPDPENPALPMLAFAPDTISRFLLYGMAAIAAPFFEETFFRGVLLNSLLLRFKPIYACLLTGFLFGSVHPVGILDALVLASLGAVFAWMAYIRKSLAPSMFAHFLQNSFAYLIVYFCFAFIYRW